MARRKTSVRTKLIGWGVLALGVLVVVGIFLVSRGGGERPADAVVASASQSASTVTSQAAAPLVETSSAVESAAVASDAAPASTPEPGPSAEGPSSAELVVVDPQAMGQAQRRDMVTALVEQGVFTGVQVDDPPPKVGVTPLFQGLSPNLQRQFIGTVYAYVNNGEAGTAPLQLIDAVTGKLIGTYTAADGLKLS